MLSDVRYVTVAVPDLERTSTFAVNGLGLESVDRGNLSGPGLEQAWGLPRHVVGHCRLFGLEDHYSGLLRLVEWSIPPTPRQVPLRGRGFRAVRYVTRDLAGLWRRATLLGAQPRGEIGLHHAADGSPVTRAFDDPDGCFVIEAVEASDRAAGATSEIRRVVVACDDRLASRAFYQSLDCLAADADDGTTRVELRAPDSETDTTGILTISLESDDLDTDAARALAAGGRATAPPQLVELPQIGLARVLVIHGPDGELVELFEAQ